MFRSIALTIAVSILAFAQSNPPIPGPSKLTTEEKGNGRRIQSAVDDAGKLSSPATTISQDSATYEQQPPANDEVIRWFTGVLAAAALLQLYIYWRQTKVMEKALGATQIAAESAKLSADTAAHALKGLERADLTLIKASTTIPIGIGSEIVVVIRNHGRTKARNVLANLSITGVNAMDTERTVVNLFSQQHYPFSIGPKEEKWLTFQQFDMDDTTNYGIAVGMLRLSAAISISYQDEMSSHKWEGDGEFNRLNGTFVFHAT